MKEYIIGFFIFCVVLFLYLHVQFHLKTSNDLEMYEIEETSKEKLEEICDLRQPVLFDFDNKKIIETSSKDYIANNYPAFEIKIRNTLEKDDNAELFVPLALHSAIKLFENDKQTKFYSENNSDFLQETGVVKNLQYNDSFLRPYMVSNCNYDIMLSSDQTWTPFRYEINYRNYFLLTQGSCQIKLAPPQSVKYLYPNYDYENFEFSSPVNPWNPQPKYSADFDKLKCLEFTLLPGKTLFIPAYWWYSIKFSKNSSISCFRYRTYMNNIAIIPYISLYVLQLQNVKRDVVKKASIDILNHSTNTHEEISIQNNNHTQNNNQTQHIIPDANFEQNNLPIPASELNNTNTIGSEITIGTEIMMDKNTN